MSEKFRFVGRRLFAVGNCSWRGCHGAGRHEVRAVVEGGSRQGTYRRSLFFCDSCFEKFAEKFHLVIPMSTPAPDEKPK